MGLAEQVRLVDLSITCNLGGGGYRWGDLDLRALDLRELSCTLSCRNPRIVGLVQVLFAMFFGVL